MDDLSVKIDQLRNEMREGFKDVRSELRDVRSDLKEVRAEARSDIRDLRVEMNTRFDATQTSISLIWATTIGGFVTLAAASIVTHF